MIRSDIIDLLLYVLAASSRFRVFPASQRHLAHTPDWMPGPFCRVATNSNQRLAVLMDAAKGLSNDARFLELISAKPDYDTEARDLFRVKISTLGHIDPAHQQLLLTDYRGHLAAIVAHSDAKAQEVQRASAWHQRSADMSWKQSIISNHRKPPSLRQPD